LAPHPSNSLINPYVSRFFSALCFCYFTLLRKLPVASPPVCFAPLRRWLVSPPPLLCVWPRPPPRPSAPAPVPAKKPFKPSACPMPPSNFSLYFSLSVLYCARLGESGSNFFFSFFFCFSPLIFVFSVGGRRPPGHTSVPWTIGFCHIRSVCFFFAGRL